MVPLAYRQKDAFYFAYVPDSRGFAAANVVTQVSVFVSSAARDARSSGDSRGRRSRPTCAR
jgi:L-amino acid N-acyltransferase YncA